MKRLIPAAVIVLSSAIIAFAQEPQPTPTPPSDEGEVVRISTNLIQVDVTVTDSKGRPITDLRPDEIEIYENKKRQKITNFSFVTGQVRETEEREKLTRQKISELPPASPVKPEKVRRTVALVVDDLTLSFSSTLWVKNGLKKFVYEHLQDGDLVAIVRTGTGIGALQQFTTDKRRLLAAIDKIHFNMSGTARMSVFNPIEPSLKNTATGSRDGENKNTRIYDDSGEREFERDVNEFRESIFASGTLGAINYVIRGMKDLPGRKSVVVLSDGFKLIKRDERGVPAGSRVAVLLQSLTDLANRASVVIYTIDARGLVDTGLTAADDVAGMSDTQIESMVSNRVFDLQDSRDGLRFLAEETGGIAMLSELNIGRGIGRALDDQSYYLVGYEPDEDTFDPKVRKFNNFEVKVSRPGAKVRYRSGFYGVSEEQISKQQASPMQAFYNAITSPFSVNDISVRLNAVYMRDEKRANYLRSFLHIDVNDLNFARESDGKYKANFDIVAATFGDNGLLTDGERNTYTLSMTEDGLQNARRRGMVYQFAFPIKRSGAYQMRVAVRDIPSGKMGSASQFVEIPKSKSRLSLSGIVLENIDMDTWNKRVSGQEVLTEQSSNVVTDTAVRKFAPGSVINWAVNVYNAKRGADAKANISTQTRIFSEDKAILETKLLRRAPHAGLNDFPAMGSLRLGDKLPPGNYTLQVIVVDNNAKGRAATTSQFSSFEITE